MQALNTAMKLAARPAEDSFLDAYDALSVSGNDPGEIAKAQLDLMVEWVLHRPGELFAELRQERPIFVTAGPVVVSRFRDVLEVAGTDDIFSVLPYGIAMKRVNGGPNFVLGMDSSPELDHDLSVLKLVVRRTDLDRIRAIVRGEAQSLLDAARADARLDVADGYGRRVPALLAGSYFGVPGPAPETLMQWCRDMFAEIFVNFTEDPEIRERGLEAGRQFRAYVDGLVQQAHGSGTSSADGTSSDDVLGRMVAMQCVPDMAFTDDRIRDNLIGCVVGILDNIAAAVCNVVDFLLDRPELLATAQEAAEASDDDVLLRIVYETLRFRPPAPILVRFSTREHVLARGTERETVVPAHKVVFAANGSAMMDEAELEDPLSVRMDRPWNDYLHFGWGLHECLGKYIAQVQVVELVRALLQAGVRRLDGDDGELVYDGAFPVSFGVGLGAATAGT